MTLNEQSIQIAFHTLRHEVGYRRHIFSSEYIQQEGSPPLRSVTMVAAPFPNVLSFDNS